MPCGVLHPEHPACPCEKPEGNHSLHRGWDLVAKEFFAWPNPDFVEPVRPLSIADQKARRKQLESEVLRPVVLAAAPETHARRPVGVRSSVTQYDPSEAARRADESYQAVEPEFLGAALAGGRAVMRMQRRMTSDQLWEWTDAHNHFTEHPKAMRGILTRLIK